MKINMIPDPALVEMLGQLNTAILSLCEGIASLERRQRATEATVARIEAVLLERSRA